VTVRRGAPGTAITVTGTAFPENEVLPVQFGGTLVAEVKTTETGTFGPTAITVPAAAQRASIR
jgi:hypothetical protein